MYDFPPSAKGLERPTGSFGRDARRDFVHAFLTDDGLGLSAGLKELLKKDATQFLPLCADLIDFAHTFVEDARMHRVKVRVC